MNPDASETLCDTCGLPLYGLPFCRACEREASYKRSLGALIALKGAYRLGGSFADVLDASIDRRAVAEAIGMYYPVPTAEQALAARRKIADAITSKAVR